MEAIVSVHIFMKTKYNYLNYVNIYSFKRNKYITEDILSQYAFFCILSGKKEERICQKMTIRTTIRKNDCISQSPVSITFQCWAHGMPSQALRKKTFLLSVFSLTQHGFPYHLFTILLIYGSA